ncbi:myoneurin [Bombyx mori]|uniref:Uncharacterized protein n=2 Tax=Bombyx mori TaxID=7091 RepID=A0A8R1WJ45_BOMMO|nr:myoneurin isoform X1 [Bombyx mori]
MDFSTVCRMCLSTENLTPIFENSFNEIDYSTTVYIITGIKVERNDGLPQNICEECFTKINGILKFREACKIVEYQLIQLKNKLQKSELHFANDSEQAKLNDASENTHGYKTIIQTDNDCVTKKEEKILECLMENDEINNSLDSENSITNTFETAVHILGTNKPNASFESSDELFKANDVNNRVTCKLCQKDLSIRSVDAHMARRHPGADRRKIKCDLCDAYILKAKMNRHRKLVHGECFKCGYCKSDFVDKNTLVEHAITCMAKKKKRKVSDSSRELIDCDVCKKRMQKASLKLHVAVKHAGLGPVCEHCGKRFGNKTRLGEHCRAKHGHEKFRCGYCEFQSASVLALQNHERRHRGEKPFVCEACGAKFHAAYLLAQHRHSHRTQKLVRCELCPASFKSNNSLHVHKQTCHSNAIYKCSMCSRSYSCRHYAVKHLRHVHQYSGPAPPLTAIDAQNII